MRHLSRIAIVAGLTAALAPSVRAAIVYPVVYAEGSNYAAAVIDTKFWDESKISQDETLGKFERFRLNNYARDSDKLMIACQKSAQRLVLQLIQPGVVNQDSIVIYHGDTPIRNPDGPWTNDNTQHLFQQTAAPGQAHYQDVVKFYEDIRHGSEWRVGPSTVTYSDSGDAIGKVMERCGIQPSPASVPVYATRPRTSTMQQMLAICGPQNPNCKP